MKINEQFILAMQPADLIIFALLRTDLFFFFFWTIELLILSELLDNTLRAFYPDCDFIGLALSLVSRHYSSSVMVEANFSSQSQMQSTPKVHNDFEVNQMASTKWR
jgi:hypothetical protein